VRGPEFNPGIPKMLSEENLPASRVSSLLGLPAMPASDGCLICVHAPHATRHFTKQQNWGLVAPAMAPELEFVSASGSR
jgi:hypothetical protein